MRNRALRRNVYTIYVVLFVVPFILSFAAAAAAGMGYGSSDDPAATADIAVTAQVREKIQSDPHLNGSDIVIETRDGEVTLKGAVDSHADVTRAAKLAGYVEGVRQVDNRLTTVTSHHYGRMAPRPNCQIGANWTC